MPTARADAGAAVIDGRIYVAGGRGLAGTSSAFEVYDPQRDAWRALAPLPVGLYRAGVVASAGRIYAIGGYRSVWRTASARGWAYALDTDEWSPIADMPRLRGEHTLVAMGDRLYALGGRGAQSHRVWIYLPTRDRWELLTSELPTPRYDAAVVALDGRVFVIGGRAAGVGDLSVVEVFDAKSGRWERAADLPEARSALTAAAVGGEIHVAGGERMASGEVFADHWIYTPESDSWRAAAAVPTARRGGTAVGLDGRWYVIGGSTGTGLAALFTASDRVEIFAEAAP